MQRPHFLARGLDLSALHPGTINVSIAPRAWRLRTPRHTFRAVRWHPVEPPEHFQTPDVLELLLPLVPGLAYGDALVLAAPADQVEVT
jgi:hypothetical protein